MISRHLPLKAGMTLLSGLLRAGTVADYPGCRTMALLSELRLKFSKQVNGKILLSLTHRGEPGTADIQQSERGGLTGSEVNR